MIDERYCISRKRKSYKGRTSRSRLVKCLVRNEKLSSPSELSSANMFKLGYDRICPHNKFVGNILKKPELIWFIIIIMSCGQHGYPWPSLSTSPYHSSPLTGLQGYIPYHHIAAVCMYVRAGRSAFDWPYAGFHRSTSLTKLFLLLQQCPACLVRLAWIVFVIGGRWPYSGALWGVVARICSISQHSCVIAVKFLLQPFSQRPSSASIASSIDTTAAWKKLRFI